MISRIFCKNGGSVRGIACAILAFGSARRLASAPTFASLKVIRCLRHSIPCLITQDSFLHNPKYRCLRTVHGGSVGDRTRDHQLKRLLLYQLSYRPMKIYKKITDNNSLCNNLFSLHGLFPFIEQAYDQKRHSGQSKPKIIIINHHFYHLRFRICGRKCVICDVYGAANERCA